MPIATVATAHTLKTRVPNLVAKCLDRCAPKIPAVARVFLGLVAALTPAWVWAEESPNAMNGVYRGTIGGNRIVVEMGLVPARASNVQDGSTSDRQTYPIEGRYFYRRHGVDIHVVGTLLSDGTLRLREYKRVNGFADEFGAEWRLTIRGDHVTGIFCNCDLSRLPARSSHALNISLQRLSRQFHREFESDPLYDQLLLDYPLHNGPELQVNQDIAYIMQSDPRFGVTRPRLTRFPDLAVMARINREMGAELRWDRLRASGNLSEAKLETSLGGFYDERTIATFFPPDGLSVRVERSWYWGGAHPNYAGYTLNYSLHTGERFTLENSFRTSQGSVAEADLAALFAHLYRKHYIKPPLIETGEDCDVVFRRNTSSKENLEDAFSPRRATLFMATAGLVVIPTLLSYADSACARPVTVPYNELQPYVKKHSMLRRIVDTQKKLDLLN